MCKISTWREGKVCQGEFQIVLFTPEALILNSKWRQLLLSDVYYQRLQALIVDEAHTIKKWYI